MVNNAKINPKISETRSVSACPYCHSADIVKAGLRKKKFEEVQVYLCRHCQKKFTPLITKNRQHPVAVILQSLILYNRFKTGEEIVDFFQKSLGHKVSLKTILEWVKDYEHYAPFLRMRDFLARKINDKEMKVSECFVENRMFHNQIYDFKYHRAKVGNLIKEDFRNYKLRAIKDFLELTAAECPHQVFKESQARSSEFRNIFDLDEVKIAGKSNRATDMAKFVTQAVANNKERHERLQEFMLFCDSTTIAVEVPVLLDQADLDHYKHMLNFKIPLELKNENDVITGHIDIVQLRNGMIHILDYKPGARKEKPIEQLTIYALALSRLTSLRLYNFKCAWFDEDDYYEFYPLHVVYKKKAAKKITTIEGDYMLNENAKRIEKIRAA
jgi:ATP-dependent exoDNAse (exonuclease V) beta subunit